MVLQLHPELNLLQHGEVTEPPPITRDTQESGDIGIGKEMRSKPGLTAPPSPQWGTSAGRGSEVNTHRYPDSADRSRTEHNALAQRKHGLLAPEEPAGNPAATELLEHGDGHKATMGTGVPNTRETETKDRNGKRAILACVQPEEADEEWRPPKRQRTFNTCRHQGWEGEGGPLTQQYMPTT